MTFLTFRTRPRGHCLPSCWPLFPQMPWPWLLHGSVALSRALILRLNSHLPLLTHASCCIYLFLSLLLSPVLSCFILPYPANLMSLLYLPLSPAHSLPPPPLLLSPCLSLPRFPPSLVPFPLLWRSGMMQSQRARPCLITLIKHPVR